MLAVSLAQPGLAVAETEGATEPSGSGGADFAALMAAMAAACVAPTPAPEVPSTATGPGDPARDADAVPTGGAALLSAFGWAGPGPFGTLAPTGAGGAGSPAGPVPAGPASVSPEADGAPAPAPPSVDAGETGAPANGGLPELPRPGTGRKGAPTGAGKTPSSTEPSVDPAALATLGAVSGSSAEGSNEADAGEAPGPESIRAAAPAHDRLHAPGAHPGGALTAAEVSRAAEAPAAPAASHPPVAEQVVSVVEPLRHRGDGRHELTLDLRPAELGPIRVEVSIERGTVHLSLHADQASTGTLLHQAMPELRAALEEAGLVAGRLGVGPGDREGGRPPAQSHPAQGDEPRAGRSEAVAVSPLRPPAAPAAGALDLLL